MDFEDVDLEKYHYKKVLIVVLIIILIILGYFAVTRSYIIQDRVGMDIPGVYSPEIGTMDMSVEEVEYDENIVFDIEIPVINRNFYPITIDRITYDIVLEGETIGVGETDEKITVPADGEKSLETKLEPHIIEAVDGAHDVFWNKVMNEDSELNIDGFIHVDTMIGTLSVPFEETITVE